MNLLADRFGRRFPYIRLSLTDVCNFRCQYCLPNGYARSRRDDFLSTEEILRLVRALSGLGVEKVRLTGGEPTLRRDLTTIAAALSCLPGLRTIGLTTNGYNLKDRAADFFAAGITALNVSVDSLDRATFQRITGHDKLESILEGIAAARRAGFRNIKINAVLLKNTNDTDLSRFLDWIRHEDISVRFIELMRTGDNQAYFEKNHLRAAVIRQQLLELGFLLRPRSPTAGPAVEFEHPDYRGRIGLIAPYSRDFCASCNRLRITARGELRLCLFGERGYDLRPLLAQDDQTEALQETFLRLLHFKRETHALHQGDTGITPHLASLGG